MPGTVSGGKKAAATNKAKFGPDHFKKLGRMGGLAGRGKGYTGGFAHPDADPSAAGAKGGRKSRRTGVKNPPKDQEA